MRRPISSIETALAIYYNHPMLGSKEIKELFGIKANDVVRRLKNEVDRVAIERELLPMGGGYVETDLAFEVWGIDVANLEKRLAKKRKLGLEA